MEVQTLCLSESSRDVILTAALPSQRSHTNWHQVPCPHQETEREHTRQCSDGGGFPNLCRHNEHVGSNSDRKRNSGKRDKATADLVKSNGVLARINNTVIGCRCHEQQHTETDEQQRGSV